MCGSPRLCRRREQRRLIGARFGRWRWREKKDLGWLDVFDFAGDTLHPTSSSGILLCGSTKPRPDGHNGKP